jgi:hypothetical protein
MSMYKSQEMLAEMMVESVIVLAEAKCRKRPHGPRLARLEGNLFQELTAYRKGKPNI